MFNAMLTYFSFVILWFCLFQLFYVHCIYKYIILILFFCSLLLFIFLHYFIRIFLKVYNTFVFCYLPSVTFIVVIFRIILYALHLEVLVSFLLVCFRKTCMFCILLCKPPVAGDRLC